MEQTPIIPLDYLREEPDGRTGGTLPSSGNDTSFARLSAERKDDSTFTQQILRRRFRWDEFLAEKVITLVAFVSLAAIVMIFVFVFREAAPIFFQQERVQAVAEPAESETYGEEFLGEVNRERSNTEAKANLAETGGAEGRATLASLSSSTWQPVSGNPQYGILPLVAGSLKVTLLAILIAAPIAVLAALFTASFAPRWAKEVLKPAIETLAGFPSVVIGFFALVELASLLQSQFGYDFRLNAFVGGVAMSLAVIPIIYTVTDDALTAVPHYLTEASLALGASKWQTAVLVTLPAATPGVFAAILLGIGRAFGETMIVLMATGNAAMLSLSMVEPVRTMSATIGAEMAEVVFGDTHYTVLFLLGSILFLFTFLLNAAAEVFIRQRLLKRFRGI